MVPTSCNQQCSLPVSDVSPQIPKRIALWVIFYQIGLTLFYMKHSWFSLPRSSAVWCVMHYCLLQIVKLISFVTGAGIKPCSPEMGCPCINLICASFQATLYIFTRVSLFAVKSTLSICLFACFVKK